MQEPELIDVKPANSRPWKNLSELKDGESISGILLRKSTNERFGGKVYKIYTNDGELIDLNGTYKLNNFMEVIDEGSYVKVVVLGRKTIATGELIEVDVKQGTESAWVKDRRALAESALAASESGQEQESSESLDSIFAGESLPL